MRKTFLFFVMFCLPSLYSFAEIDTYDRLASFQTIINAQRTNAASLIINSNLIDSVKNKPYCVFFMSGCRGIGGWVIVVSDYQDYTVYYTDSFMSAQGYLFETVCLPKENEEMQLLFSQISLKGCKRLLEYSVWYLTYYYFGLFDDAGNLSFEWNQSIWCLNTDVQKKVLHICLKYVMPFLVNF